MELILKNCKYLNVFTDSFEEGDIKINNSIIAGVGKYDGKNVIDLKGKYVVPGFINSHMHFESSVISPNEYAKCVIKHGTTTVVADPHEIANVFGEKGFKYLLETTKKIPLDAYFMLPSCVPASPFDESGAILDSSFIKKYIKNKRVLGLGEVMNYPGVINGDKDLLKKIKITKDNGKLVDGHSPKLIGEDLNKYIAAGAESDHEINAYDEAKEKIEKGMWVMIRHGSASKDFNNLKDLLRYPYVNRCTFSTDDRGPRSLVLGGDIKYLIKLAIGYGIDPCIAFKVASHNAANYFGLKDRGAIAPGYKADLVVLGDIKKVNVLSVYKDGKLVASNGKVVNSEDYKIPKSALSILPKNSVNYKKFKIKDIQIKKDEEHVIGVIPASIVTLDAGMAKKIDVKNDILKLVVAERHNNTGHVGTCFIKGYGLKSGAIATTVNHDSHNVIVVGTNDKDIVFALNHMKEIRGGLLIVKNEKVVDELPLPIAGLMSPLSCSKVYEKLTDLKEHASDLGVYSNVNSFMALSFMALPVIPKLKLTTKGVVDVDKFELV